MLRQGFPFQRSLRKAAAGSISRNDATGIDCFLRDPYGVVVYGAADIPVCGDTGKKNRNFGMT